MRNRFPKDRVLEPILLIVLTALYYASPWRHLPGPREAWGVPFLLCYLLFLPGRILRRILYPYATDVLERGVLGTLCGLFYLLFVCFVWALSGTDLDSFQTVLPASLIPILALSFYRIGRAGSTQALQRNHRGCALFTLIVCVLIFCFVWISGPPVDYMKDTLDHIGYVAEIRETGEAFPTTAFYAEAGEDGKDIRKGLLHVFYGFTCGYLEIDPLPCLRAWNAFFAAMLVLSVYGVSLALFHNHWIAALSCVLYLISGEGGISGAAIREAFYANRFGFCFFLFLITFVLRYLEKPNGRSLVCSACFAFAASAVHIFYAMLSCLAIAMIAVWKPCFPKNTTKVHLSRVLRVGAALLAGIAPYALYRFFTGYREPSLIHREIQGIVYVANGLFIEDPFKFLSWTGALGVVTLFAAIALWRQRGAHTGLGYLIAASFTVPAVLLNPLLLPLFHRAIAYLIFRLPQLLPFYMIAAYYLVYFLTERRRSLKSVLLFAAILIATGIDLSPSFKENTFSRSRLVRERQSSYLLWKDGLDFLGEQLPRGSIIASDPITSYSIAAFTPHYVVCTLDQHAPPADRSLEKRIQQSRDILSPFVSLRRTVGTLEGTQSRHIMLNGRMTQLLRFHYLSIDPDVFGEMRRKFDSSPGLFDALFDRDGLLILRWNGEHPSEQFAPENPYLLRETPDSFTPIHREAGEARLEAFHIDQRQIERGQILSLSCIWSSDRIHRLRNYIVAVRFDHQNPDLPLGGRPFPKILRKLKEALTSTRYRFREDHKIHQGFLNPDVWPIGALVLDETSIRIPSDVAPGEYTISVKLLALTAMPCYRLRDLFYDDDTYQGVPISPITIR